MMKYLLLISLIFSLFSCNSDSRKEAAEEELNSVEFNKDTSSVLFNEALNNDTLIKDETGEIKINWDYLISNDREISQEYLLNGVKTIRSEKDRSLIFQIEKNNKIITDTLNRFDFAGSMQDDFMQQGQLSDITFLAYDADFERVLFFVKFGIAASEIQFDVEYRLYLNGKSELIYLEME